jgi:hypothetical protein
MSLNEEEITKDNKINISDWLQYLEHESGISSSHLFSFWSIYFVVLAILLSMTIIVLSYGEGYSMFGIELGVIFVLIVFVISIVIFTSSVWFNRDSKYAKIRDSAEKLLIEILLEHKYQTTNAIEKKWEDELDRINRKSGWIRPRP